MALFSVSNMRIDGIAAAVPEPVIHNRDYDRITEAERKLLIRTTGIGQRHVAPAGLTTADLCRKSAERLIETLNWDKNEIGLLIFVSQSPDYLLPATAIILQDQLGLPKTTAAFDIMLGCSGYVYGLSVINALMATGGFKKGLLLAGDISSHSLDPDDKSTWPLFGDAGTATAVSVSPSSTTFFNLQSDGSGYDAIIIPDGGLRHPVNEKTFEKQAIEPGVTRHRRNLWLNGLDVFNFSVREAPPNISALLNYASLTTEAIDYFIFHQANRLMNETIRKKLRIPPEKVPYSLEDYGNTSSASIPLTVVSQLHAGTGAPLQWVFSGFGVGLSWASCLLKTEQLQCPELIIV